MYYFAIESREVLECELGLFGREEDFDLGDVFLLGLVEGLEGGSRDLSGVLLGSGGGGELLVFAGLFLFVFLLFGLLLF